MQVHIRSIIYQFLWCTHVHKTSRFEAERVFYMRVTIIVGVLLEEAPQPMSAEDYSHLETSVRSQAWRVVNTHQMIRPTVSLLNLLWPCLHFISLCYYLLAFCVDLKQYQCQQHGKTPPLYLLQDLSPLHTSTPHSSTSLMHEQSLNHTFPKQLRSSLPLHRTCR